MEQRQAKENKLNKMIKKNLLMLLMALSLFAAAPASRAEIDIPVCFPCDGN